MPRATSKSRDSRPARKHTRGAGRSRPAQPAAPIDPGADRHPGARGRRGGRLSAGAALASGDFGVVDAIARGLAQRTIIPARPATRHRGSPDVEHPFIYEINTWVWLEELRAHGTLGEK